MKLSPGLIVAAAFLVMVCISSCRRDYTCQCEISYSGQPGLPDTIYRDYPITDTKKKAKDLCEKNSSVTDKEGITTTENCYLY